jgi:hypothetical protein
MVHTTAYWRDPETKRLKKRYVGRHYFPKDEQKGQEEKDYYTDIPS